MNKFDPMVFFNAMNDAENERYFSIDDLDPIVCGNSGIYLEPIAPDFSERETIIKTLPILFGSSKGVHTFLPTLDFSSKEKIEQFARVTMMRTMSGLQFTYGIYNKGILLGMIMVNTPSFNKTTMGLQQWTLDFFVFAPFEGQGFMRIAFPRMMMFLKNKIGVKSFWLLIDEDNNRCIDFIRQFPIDELDNNGFRNLDNSAAPPLVFECPLSTIRFQ